MLWNGTTGKVWTHLICRASGQDELTVGIEGQAVDLRGVGVHCVAGLGGVVGPCVPAGPKQTKVPLLE